MSTIDDGTHGEVPHGGAPDGGGPLATAGVDVEVPAGADGSTSDRDGHGRVSRLLDLNPVLRRELLERWRGRRAVLVLSLYVAALGALLLLLRWIGTMVIEQERQWNPAMAMASGPVLGRFLFENLLALVLGLVLLVAPGYAAAQLSGERERRTLGLLRITLIRPRSIVLGKLGASTAWIVLLVLVAAPLSASAIVLGGVTVGDLLRGVLVVLVVAVAVAAIALAVSSRARRTTGAVVTTYAIVILLAGGTVLAAVAQFAVNDFRRIETPIALYLNPFHALADATNADATTSSGLPTILQPFAYVMGGDRFDAGFPGPMPVEDVGVGGEWFAVDGDVPRGAMVEGPVDPDGFPVQVRPAAGGGGVPTWVITILLYGVLAVGSIALAARSLGPRTGVRET